MANNEPLIDSVPSAVTMPRWFVPSIILICAAPLLLSAVGVDMGALIHHPDANSLLGADAVDVMHNALAGSFIHVLLEWSAFGLALVTVVLSLMHYRVAGGLTTPIIGIALFYAGCMDAFHTLAAVRLIHGVAEPTNLIPFTWAICRLFTAVILIVGAMIALMRKETASSNNLRLITVTSLALGVIAFTVIDYCAISEQLPQTMYPQSTLTRPYDVAPLVLFVFVCTPVFYYLHRHQKSVFSYALLVSLIPHTVTQMYMAFDSTVLFDHAFNVAHGLKIVAYGVPFVGLLFDYMRTYHEQRRVAFDLKNQMEQIKLLNAQLSGKTAEVEQLVYTVSHDLKSPVVTTLGYIGCIREDLETGDLDEVRESVDCLERSAQRMNQAIIDLLDLSRLDRVWRDPQRTYMRRLLDEVAQELAPRLKKAGVALQLDAYDWDLMGEPMQIREVFENLLINAVKYGCDAPNPVISIGQVSLDQELRFFVRDNGRGIDPKHHGIIFGLFKRLKTNNQEGTGVGLTAVKRIMELHDGRVWVESQPNQGATFWLAFPQSAVLAPIPWVA